MSSQQKEDQHACRVTRKKVHARKMLGTSRIAVCFSMIRGSWCSKSSLAKAAGAEVAVQQTGEKMARGCGAKHMCKSKCTKTPHCRSHFGSSDVQKWRAAVARSLFWSHNVKKPGGVGALFEVPMFKNATRLWRKAHLQVKMHKTPHVRTTFWRSDVQKSHSAVARSTFASQNVQSTCFLKHFERFLTGSLTNELTN